MTINFLKGIAVIAAGLIASAAPAQTAPPATPPASSPTDTMAPPSDSMAPADSTATPPADAMTPAPMQQDAMAGPMLEKRGNKWYSGDREATKAEIDAHKKAMKPKSR